MIESNENRVASGGGGRFLITVNDVELRSAEPVVNGEWILDAAGYRPVGAHVLVRLLFPGTRPVGLDESLDLRHKGADAFWAFKGDRIFRFMIDERGYEWGAAKITESELRRVAVVDDDATLVLERDGKAVDLAADDIVELGETNTERLRVVEFSAVTLNNEVKKVPSDAYKMEELICVLDVEDGYLLDVLDEHGKLNQLQPGQMIQVKTGMKFYSHVPAGGSS